MVDLKEAVYAASTPRESKLDVIDYFQERYPGVRIDKNGRRIEEWKSKIVDALLPIATGKDGQPLSRANLMRRFQGGRAEREKVTPKAAEEYRKLGETIPPIPPDNGFRIVGTICVSYSEVCEARDIDITITGDEAADLVNDPDIQRIINRYNGQDPEEEEEPEAGPCSDGYCIENYVVEPL